MIKIKSLITSVLIFLFPIFFLTTTQEFYVTNKFYLLGFGVLALLTLNVINLVINKKLSWKRSPFDAPVVIFIILYAASIIIVSPNKIQALVNPVNGFLSMLSLALFYFIIQQETHTNRENKHNHLGILNISATILGLLTIFFFFNPFAKVVLPNSLAFLKSPFFTPIGNQIDLVVFLGFFAVYGGLSLYYSNKAKEDAGGLRVFSFIVVAIALCLSLYNVLRPVAQAPGDLNQTGSKQNISILQGLPPYSVSWYAAIETLKDPKTALFGVGPENYASLYTRVKPLQYNGTNFWNINFTQSRSFLLEIWATVGLLGLGAFILLLFTLLRAVSGSEAKFNTYFLIAAFLLFPISLPLLFILILMLTATGQHLDDPTKTRKADISNNPAIYGSLAIVFLLLIGALGYVFGRSYLAEYYFKRSLDNLSTNNAQLVYNDMARAIQLNPYIERFRINFSQLNMLIANNAANRAAGADGKGKISDQDRQIITQTIQTAIAEAKSAVALNPNKASSWENLAVIYRNILNVAQGADQWTVASYQRAIIMDPRNPIYPLNLGGVFYSLKDYNNAERLFEQSVGLKPDWANAHYNLAWSRYQKGDFAQAAAEMEAVLSLLTDQKSADYKQAKKDLENFKKKIPADGEATKSATGAELNLPVPPAASIEPKLKLEEKAKPPVNISPTKEATPAAQ